MNVSAPMPSFPEPLNADEIRLIDAWWRAANYLSVGQIYLLDNPLLRVPLTVDHIKPRLLGHFGTTPGLNFIYVHLNRVIRAKEISVLFIAGPGHGAPGVVASTYLEGTYSELYPEIGRDEDGMRRLFRQFSFPGGIPSHAAPQTPGSIHEGGELGYSLSHAYGAVLDNPGLIAACVVGDGEAETGPLAAAWHSNKFINPATDGAVLPILHLNGFKIANPTVLARIPSEELTSLLAGYGHDPIFVEGSDPTLMHQAMAHAMDQATAAIRSIQDAARTGAATGQPRWPMIVLRSPKGWTGPKSVDGLKTEGSWRAHQVPIADMAKAGHLQALEDWMRSYQPEDLFDADGALRPEIAALAPVGALRMSANPHANGGTLIRPLRMPDLTAHAVPVLHPGATDAEATAVMGAFLRDVMQMNADTRNFRIVGPDETASNRLQALFEATGRDWDAATIPDDDEHLSTSGRVMEILSEHTCQGWLEGYLLTGRHGLFSCYEAFIHIVDRSWDRINVIVAGKQPEPQWLDMEAAIKHCERGLGIWEFASNDRDGEPDVVMACAGDVPTLECLAAVDLLRRHVPDLKVRVVNVVDLMTLQPKSQHPHGMDDAAFDALFTTDKPVIFAFHGYPSLIHRLIYSRTNHGNFHVHGFQDEGTTTTPFDMVVLNKLDRFHLVMDVLDRVPRLGSGTAHVTQTIRDKLIDHTRFVDEHGIDMPEVLHWRWLAEAAGTA